jgi:hypothetical protein
MYQSLPDTYEGARPVIERVFRETAATVTPLASIRKRPDPPRSLIAQSGSLEALITWNAPQKSNDIAGWRIYKDDEKTLIDSILDPAARQYRPKLPANTPTAFYISAINGAGRESIKVQVIVTANTDQAVVSGTTGATSGTSPKPPAGYGGEPTGGGQGRRYQQ